MRDPTTVQLPSARPWAAPLTRGQRYGLWLLLAVFVVFGGLVELRSAFLSRHMGDLGVFLRTAWAVRAGEDIYQIADDNRFHYHYPPLFAILLTPLADAPAGADRSGMLPYAVTVALWYCLNLLFLGLAVHWLASALEQAAADPAVRTQPRGSQRWWALRIVPVLVCLPPIGHTLMRGQVNLLLLLVLCGMAAAVVRGQRAQAGLCLAGAICLKVIPVFLLLFPLWRRDGRCLAACALGLVVGLGLVPLAVFGPERTLAYYQEWADVLVRPGLGAGDDLSRARELIEVTATDSQSFQAIIHNSLYPDPVTRPQQVGPIVRLAHWLSGGLLTALTLLAARRGRRDAIGQMLFLGTLVLVMVLVSPVCHLHYFCLAVPLVMALLATAWEERTTLTPSLALGLLFGGTIIANSLPHMEFFQRLRDGGLAAYAALLCWLAGLVLLGQRSRGRAAAPQCGQSPLAA